MKTALFTMSYLDGMDFFGNNRFERQVRWTKWYCNLEKELGFEAIFYSDNHSSEENSNKFIGLQRKADIKGLFWYENRHLTGGGNVRYPYCWRALYRINDLFESLGYEKVIFIDTDAFILTQKLAHFVGDLKSGWTAFHERKHNFPSAEFHVLCKDAFWIYKEFTSVPYMTHMGKMMETSLPFTDVRTDFYCERSGEERKPQAEEQDLYGQASLDIELCYK